MQVCPVEGAWVGGFLQKLRGIDVQRLSGAAAADEIPDPAASVPASVVAKQPTVAAASSAKKDSAALNAARARFAARKAARTK